MKPLNVSNFIFDVNVYKKTFAPLRHNQPNDYYFMIEIVTKGADIKRTEIPPPISHPNYPISDPKLIEAVTKKFLHHLLLGQFWGPFSKNELPKLKYRIHTSPIAAKFKASGKAMIIVDESSPKFLNINSVIDPWDKTVSYSTFLDLCLLLQRVGPRGWIWIADAVDAYYRIPIQKRFYHLFGIEWLNKILIYKCLSFGLSTAPSIYNRFADLIVWACTYWHKSDFKCNGTFNILHYLDDFFGGHKTKSRAALQMNYLKKMFKKLGIPTNDKKCIGPAQTAAILGWKCTTIPTPAIGLTLKKIDKYTEFLLFIKTSNTANLKQFERLIGYTVHTCQIFITCTCFVRGFTTQKCSLQKQVDDPKKKNINKFSPIYLSHESKFDLDVWLQLFKDSAHNMIDIDFFLKPDTLNKIKIWTDASTSYGAGGLSSNDNIYPTLDYHKNTF